MARTIKDIQEAIQSDFISDSTIIDKYGLDTTKTFADQFSKVSIEAIFIYITALAIHLFERILDLFKEEIETKVEKNAICSVPWYHRKFLEFQYGNSLEYDSETFSYRYASDDDSKQIIKFVAVRQIAIEGVTKLRVYLSKANKAALSATELNAVKMYASMIGAAGTHFDIISLSPQTISCDLEITYNPMILSVEGESLADGGYPVNDAISGYLDNILYGGVFNRTKLIDAIQEVEGVTDVVLNDVRLASETVNTQNLESISGSFIFNSDSSNITYTVYEY